MIAMLKPLLAFAALMVLGASAAAEINGTAVPPPKSEPNSIGAILADPMVFYLAKGEPDACGPGCSEWIAAEGSIDLGAAQRLRALLSRLGKRKLPIYFHSPGGLGGPSMDIGRILREREMTAGVSKTIPAGCVAASAQSCQVLKHSGQVLSAELNSLGSCNSACVYALIGAKIRQVPPGSKLGVHSARLVRLYSDGRVKGMLQGNPSAQEKSRTAELDAEFRRYLQEMRMDAGLFAVVSRTPFEKIHYLSRDEIAGFGIDTREFQETPWIAVELPSHEPTAVKLIVEVKGVSHKEFRASMIKLACASARRVWIGYVRGLESDETATTRSIKFAIGDHGFSLPQKTFISKIDAIDTDRSFDTRFTYERFELIEAAATHDSIDVVESDSSDKARPPRTTRLSTNGLSKALEGLRKKCGQQPAFLDTRGVKFLDAPGQWGRR